MKKYHKLVENAVRPQGFWGRQMIKSMNKGHSALTDWALSYIEIQPKSIVLDVGCGGGNTISKLCKNIANGKVYGIDYSELCVEKSRKFNKKDVICDKARILQASVSNLPFEDDKFDFVTAVETYYFWPDKLNDLKEILRVMKHGATLLLVFEMVRDDNDPFKWERVESALGIQAVSHDEINDMLLRSGYQDIRIHKNADKGWMCVLAEKE